MGDGIAPFTNIAPDALGKKAFTINRYPGVAIFDYDRDGDLDFYVTQEEGGTNFLFRNEGDGEFSEVSEESGAAAVISNSTGVAACDFDNDGYQDLYVGAHGRKGDGLDYRSADESGWSEGGYLGQAVPQQGRWDVQGCDSVGVW